MMLANLMYSCNTGCSDGDSQVTVTAPGNSV